MPSRKLNILIVSAEVAPFAKVGGLADVAGALPKALKALGHDVRVAMPCYRMIERGGAGAVEELLPAFPVPIREGRTEAAALRRTWIRGGSDTNGGVPVYLVAGHPHFAGATDSSRVYTLDPDPYVFFNRAVAEMVPRLDPAWKPDAVHCNDWHTGLLPVYLETLYRCHPAWQRAGRVFTIHNLAHPGEYGRELLAEAGLPEHLFTYDKLEFYGRVSLLKAGLVYSDRVNTVSPTYAREIQTPEYGCRMDGLLRFLAAQGRLSGILNGIDFAAYDPATDPELPARFSAADPAGKVRCRAALQRERGLVQSRTTAVVGIVSRLADQKGFDLLREALEGGDLLNLPLQLVLLGAGEPRYEAFFRELAARHPKQVSVHIGFDEALARRIYGGSDLFLMPSRFEPCGLGQLMSLRYGTIPVVNATGGLADTIVDADRHPRRGNGFVMPAFDAASLVSTVRRALAARADAPGWDALVRRALAADFSWERSAKEYVALYRSSGR